jgi:hypothetical protein
MIGHRHPDEIVLVWRQRAEQRQGALGFALPLLEELLKLAHHDVGPLLSDTPSLR